MTRILSLLVILALLTVPSAAAATNPRSVIFIIGDGMGPAHFTAAMLLRGEESRLKSMPITGLVTTHCTDSVVTDSAAAATALATGVKTKYRYVGVDPAGKPVQTALEVAEKSGRITALVTTANFFDATPASFAAHVISRYDEEVIIRQMLQSGAEIIVGGGLAKLGTEKIPATLEQLAAQYRYTAARTLSDLENARGARILGAFNTQKNEVDFPEASLPQLAEWTLDRLSRDKKPFFVLLEHEGTDGASHNNATAEFEASVRSLDETISIALAYADKHPDVLVVVTGDHETGGLMVAPEKIGAPLEFRWSVGSHTGEVVPIFAKGPGAEKFKGLMDNTDVGKRIIELLGSGKENGRKATVTLRK